MKIKKLKFIKHPIFINHTVIFGDQTIPIISFLVGNNGSGKTHVLEALYSLANPVAGDYEIEFWLELLTHEKTRLEITESEVICKITRVQNNISINTRTVSGGVVRKSIQDIAKIVFSTIEVNFDEHKFASVTSKNIDEVTNPKERSLNIAAEIPQLLIDIDALDNDDRGKWMSKHSGQTIQIPDNIGVRIKRFTNAFERIYAGQKTFAGIKNIAGSKHVMFVDNQGKEVSLNQLSTGEKQIIFRIGYILKNLGNIDGGIILIDEPEISLHPTWQIKLKEFLIELFSGYDVQIIIATHSPYIFKNLDESNEVCIKIDRTHVVSRQISMIFPSVPYNPSVLLIGYLAYGIVDEMLHIELYTLLQIKEGKTKITNSPGANDGIENWLRLPAGGNMPVRQRFTRAGHRHQTEESIMTWIRNKIHHGDETARPHFTEADLKLSIDEMIGILRR